MDTPVSERFPEFTWDTLVAAKKLAAEHPDGALDLAMGTPVDDTPEVVQAALTASANAPAYPTVWGPESLRQAAVDWLHRNFGVDGLSANDVLPTIGSKEFIGNLPAQLGLGRDDLVVIPKLSYPTYEVGARYVGARTLATDATIAVGPERPALVYVNSPANPHGQVLPADHLRKVIDWVREIGAVLVSDECYLEFVWDGDPVSVLHPDINGGSLDRILAVHSLSKRSNLAGYRCGFVAGDPHLIAELLQVRKHLGFMVPAPVQAACAAALADDDHVAVQRARYAARRQILSQAFLAAGYVIDDSAGGLYLWVRGEHSGLAEAQRLAEKGIVVVPGVLYGSEGAGHFRVALTASDEAVRRVADRLRG